MWIADGVKALRASLRALARHLEALALALHNADGGTTAVGDQPKDGQATSPSSGGRPAPALAGD